MMPSEHKLKPYYMDFSQQTEVVEEEIIETDEE